MSKTASKAASKAASERPAVKRQARHARIAGVADGFLTRKGGEKSPRVPGFPKGR